MKWEKWLPKELEKSGNTEFVPGQLIRQHILSHFRYICLILEVKKKTRGVYWWNIIAQQHLHKYFYIFVSITSNIVI